MLDEEKLVSVPANRVGRVIGSRGAVIQARRTTHHSLLTAYHLPLTTHHSPLTTHHSPRCSRRCVWRRARRSTCRKTTPPVRPRWRYAARRRRWPRPSWPSSASSRRALKRAHSHPMPGAIPLYSMICHTVIREETAAKKCVALSRKIAVSCIYISCVYTELFIFFFLTTARAVRRRAIP
jgi:hypothetical protein